MKATPRFKSSVSLAFATILCLSVHASVAGAQYQGPPPPPPDQGSDPAMVNEAAPPDGYDMPSGSSYSTEAPPPDQNPDDYNYAPQPTQVAPQPPPPLPDYDQPPAPNDGYIWTPGYWAWSPRGYYWVPGAWVAPPYMGALWTPGYWGFYTGRYMFYPGHWGTHIGFYGGINYGFGYLGFGYEGGYWRSGHFFYNRAYNRINERVVHNVYEFHAPARGFDDHRGNYNQHDNGNRGNFDPHSSYRGGPGGVPSHPQPSEGAAWHEPTAPTMHSQSQHEQKYGGMRGQYSDQNHGTPPSPAINRPLPADRNVHPQPQYQNRGGGGQDNHGNGHQDDHHH